ncbi:MAG: DNA topoisomerase VI subunit B [Promethearchaeota archaeon]
MTTKDEGKIKQGTIAQFMRKRTQLVGFEFGHWKHAQYCAEFLDNALDAIESFQWMELNKKDSKIMFSLDQDLFLGSLTILKNEKQLEKSQPLSNEGKRTLMLELGIEQFELKESGTNLIKEKEEHSQKEVDKDKEEVEEEVKKIINDLEELIKPVEYIIDLEPIAIIRLSESEAASFLTSELSQKNIMNYTFEIFDNGTGMCKVDFKKFGKYLASSKSIELKQTRGSQGFGAPSAFSDAQNTTGRPIIAISKSAENIYATVSEFFTTSKNEKKYIVYPTDIDCPFLHGTYIKLNYLNVKYIRGYVDKFIEETAYMNPHITLIYIDPNGEETIYKRLVSSFPKEPKFAKPHPSSTNIGDLQDLLAKSEKNTLSSFLKENFVRISSKIAQKIIDLASKDLQDNLNFLILKNGFINKISKKSDPIYLLRYEKRIFGKSKKPRDKLIIYEVDSEDLKNKYWELISNYNQLQENHKKINNEIKKFNYRMDKSKTLKEIKFIEKEIKSQLKKIDEIRKEKEIIKIKLENVFENVNEGLSELKKFKKRSDFEDLVNEVEISKVKPIDITKNQFNSLFRAFKSIKYMMPPTDTAIPVGDTVLENTLIKEIGLKIRENVDDFAAPVDNIYKIIDIIRDEKKNAIIREDPTVNDLMLNKISVSSEEIIDLNSKILTNIDLIDKNVNINEFKQSVEKILTFSEEELKNNYNDVFEFFLMNYTKDDDFVSAETRPPTSGKGLAYVVEAVLAYSKNLGTPKRARDVLSRFVNRTPKLRDTADCAITKAVQSVNWKNYKLETYDNNLPKGPIKLLVNISGPFVHLMFKSQSKSALADDEKLKKEIKFCLEAIGRKLRIYLNRKANMYKSEKRASLIEKNIPRFVKSVYNIASRGESIYKARVNEKELIDLMKNAIGQKPPSFIKREISQEPPGIEPPKPIEIKDEYVKKVDLQKKELAVKKEKTISKKEPVVKKPEHDKEFISVKTLNNYTVKELKEYCNEKKIKIPSKISKVNIIKKISESFEKKSKLEIVKEPIISLPVTSRAISIKQQQLKIANGKAPASIKLKPSPKPRVSPPKPKTTQTQLPIITTERILEVLSKEEWQAITHLIFKLKIKDMMDARFLQIKLKELFRKGLVLENVIKTKKHWKLK